MARWQWQWFTGLVLGLSTVLALPNRTSAQPTGQQPVVRTLTTEWLIFDRRTGQYLPYLPEEHAGQLRRHLWLATHHWQQYSLQLQGVAGARVFINNRLLETDLSAAYRLKAAQLPSAADTVLVTLQLADTATLAEPTAQWVLAQEFTLISAPRGGAAIIPQPRKGQNRPVWLSGLLVVTLFVYTGMFGLLKPSLSLGDIQRSVTQLLLGRAQQQHRLEADTFLTFVVYYGVGMAFLILFLAHYTTGLHYSSFFPPTLLGRLTEYILLLGGVLVWATAKVLLVSILAALYNLPGLASQHVHEHFVVSRTMGIVAMAVGVWAYFNLPWLPESWLAAGPWCLVAALAIRNAIVSVRLLPMLPGAGIYLFSYLCSTELLPLLMLIWLGVRV